MNAEMIRNMVRMQGDIIGKYYEMLLSKGLALPDHVVVGMAQEAVHIMMTSQVADEHYRTEYNGI